MNTTEIWKLREQCSKSAPRPHETAVLNRGSCRGSFLDMKGGLHCPAARLDADNGQIVSEATLLQLPNWVSRTGSILFASGFFFVRVAVAQEVGELSQRTVPQGTEAALSVLQNARNVVQKRLANIASQADPLGEAVASYRANPTPDTALALLKREAVVAGIGAKECESIADEAATVAKACAGLAAQTQAAAEMLRPGLEKAARARAEHATTREIGFRELKAIHRSLLVNGVTNEATMSAAEKRKVATLLRLAGAADLSERFLKMEAGATDQVIARLNKMSEQFVARQRSFADLADAYKLHSASFKTVGGSVAQVARLIDVNQRFDNEAKTAAELETELARVDDVLGKTFGSLPDDFSAAFTPASTSSPSSDSTGLWGRFLRFIGLSDQPEPVVTSTVADTETKGVTK